MYFQLFTTPLIRTENGISMLAYRFCWSWIANTYIDPGRGDEDIEYLRIITLHVVSKCSKSSLEHFPVLVTCFVRRFVR